MCSQCELGFYINFTTASGNNLPFQCLYSDNLSSSTTQVNISPCHVVRILIFGMNLKSSAAPKAIVIVQHPHDKKQLAFGIKHNFNELISTKPNPEKHKIKILKDHITQQKTRRFSREPSASVDRKVQGLWKFRLLPKHQLTFQMHKVMEQNMVDVVWCCPYLSFLTGQNLHKTHQYVCDGGSCDVNNESVEAGSRCDN